MGKEQKTYIERAMEDRANLVEMIDRGQVGATVAMPLGYAALISGIGIESWRRMGERGEALKISVVGNQLQFELQFRERTRRQIYELFYGLVAAMGTGSADHYLEKIGEVGKGLLTTIPGFDSESLNVLVGKTHDLGDEDLGLLHLQLFAYYWSLRDRANLNHPKDVLVAATTR
jgi:hypothetical protein